MTEWWAALFAGSAVALVVPGRGRWLPGRPAGPASSSEGSDWLRRGRVWWSLLAAIAGATFVSGPGSLPSGVVVAATVWVWIGRAEPASVKRRREAAERQLPALVHLLAGALESGRDVGEALRFVCAALPGPASDLVRGVPARLSLGVSPDLAWQAVVADPQLAPLGRAMVRAHRSGASVTHEVARLADDLERRALLQVEQRARAVGVKAAVPLGVCLLPAFLLIGIVPLVVGLLRSLSL